MDFIDPEIWAFIEIGLIINLVSIICSFVFTLFKAWSLSENELQQVIAFSQMRQVYIKKYNSNVAIYGAFLMNFVPMYSAVLNAWYIFNMLIIPGGQGIVSATIKSDRLALVSLVRYDMVQARDK